MNFVFKKMEGSGFWVTVLARQAAKVQAIDDNPAWKKHGRVIRAICDEESKKGRTGCYYIVPHDDVHDLCGYLQVLGFKNVQQTKYENEMVTIWIAWQ